MARISLALLLRGTAFALGLCFNAGTRRAADAGLGHAVSLLSHSRCSSILCRTEDSEEDRARRRAQTERDKAARNGEQRGGANFAVPCACVFSDGALLSTSAYPATRTGSDLVDEDLAMVAWPASEAGSSVG